MKLNLDSWKTPTVVKRQQQGKKALIKENANGVRLIINNLLCSAAIALSWGALTPVFAADSVTVRFGPIQETVDIADLDVFAKTGKLPDSLKPYAALLTPQVQQLLIKKLQVNPNFADKFVDQLLHSAQGDQFLNQIRLAIPNSTVEQVRSALTLAVRQGNGLSPISFLRAYPGENVTVDVSSALGIALQFNAPHLQSQALSALMERDLTVPDSSFHPTFDPSALGTQQVHKETLTLQDKQRNRTLLVDMYWGEVTNRPLVVISPGLGANRLSLAYLAHHLATYGITVATLQHPDGNITEIATASIGNVIGNGRGIASIPASEFIDRPKDITFVLDELAKLNQQPGFLQGRLNTNQVSVIGHSLGGFTALAVGGAELNLDDLRQYCKQANVFTRAGADWLECVAATLPQRRIQLRDKRVAQVIALNPVTGALFGKEGLAKVTIPTLIWTSTDDSLAPTLTHQLWPFTKLGGAKYLVTAIGATHLSVSDPIFFHSQENTVVPEVTGAEAYPVRQLLQGVSLAFVEQLTPEAKNYQQFLTPAYAQSLSTPQLALRLSTQLPASISSLVESPTP